MPTNRRQLSTPEPYDMDPAVDARAQAMITQAEQDIAERAEVRVNFRWGRAQVDMLKRAAAIYDVPYQTYLKIVALRAAQQDLQGLGARSGEQSAPNPPRQRRTRGR